METLGRRWNSIDIHTHAELLSFFSLTGEIFFYGRVEVCSFNERGPGRTFLYTAHLCVYTTRLSNVIILRTVARNRRS